MSRTMQAVVCALLAAGLIWVSGCGGEKATNTPADALKKAAQAQLVGDKEAYLASVKVSPGSSDYIDAKMEERKEARAFMADMVKAYGKDDKIVAQLVASDTFPLGDAAKHADTMKVITTGNIASGNIDPLKVKVHFFLEGGVWKVDLSKDMENRNLIGDMNECKGRTAALRKGHALVGKEGNNALAVMRVVAAAMPK